MNEYQSWGVIIGKSATWAAYVVAAYYLFFNFIPRKIKTAKARVTVDLEGIKKTAIELDQIVTAYRMANPTINTATERLLVDIQKTIQDQLIFLGKQSFGANKSIWSVWQIRMGACTLQDYLREVQAVLGRTEEK